MRSIFVCAPTVNKLGLNFVEDFSHFKLKIDVLY